MSYQPNDSDWDLLVKQAHLYKEQGQIFTSITFQQRYRIIEVSKTLITIERLDGNKPATVGKKQALNALYKLSNSSGIMARRDFHYTVAIESALVALHPDLSYTDDEQEIYFSDGEIEL